MGLLCPASSLELKESKSQPNLKTTMNTPTPRTDPKAFLIDGHASSGHLVLASFARELERELTEKDAQIVALRDALTAYREALSDGPENCSYLKYEKVDEAAESALAKLTPLSSPSA